jgi:hypothetical protein
VIAQFRIFGAGFFFFSLLSNDTKNNPGELKLCSKIDCEKSVIKNGAKGKKIDFFPSIFFPQSAARSRVDPSADF